MLLGSIGEQARFAIIVALLTLGGLCTLAECLS